ncbi:MAG: hypothetical protein IJ040_01765 [Lachnospiraceae bacterium]|nr:hypothetical protein [Lachnospiraceae bacterium]
MQVTISKQIIDRIDSNGEIIARLPGRNQYVYIKPESVIATGEHSIVADFDTNKRYIVGNSDPSGTAGYWRGDEVAKFYAYDKQYDPRYAAREHVTEHPAGQGDATQKQENKNKQTKQSVPESEPTQTPPGVPETPAVYHQPSFANTQQGYTKEQFKQLKLGQKHHLDISTYWNVNLSAEQMKQLRLMQENSVDVVRRGYNHPSVPADVLNELRMGHKAGFEMDQYNWQAMTAKQLSEVRTGLERGIDVKKYAWPAYSAEQMKQLRLGLQNGFDISAYNNPNFTAKQMYSMRCSQLFERIKEKFRELFESVKRMLQESSLGQIRAKVMDKVSEGLGRTADMLTNENSMQFFVKQQAPVQTMDDRIQETVQDIKELLVSQELVPEDVLYDTAMSEQMNTRIKEALDRLMAPENIQNVANQEQIIEATAESVIQETGVEFSSKELAEQKEALPEWNPNEMSDKELFDLIGREMELEEAIMQQEMAMTHAMEM